MLSLSYGLICLTMAVYHEARSESLIEQEIVAHVVMNRVEQRDKSVCEVVKEKNQFSWVKNGKGPRPSEVEAFLLAQKIAISVHKRRSDPTRGANHFWANTYKGKKFTPHWAKSCAWKKSYGKTTICEIPNRYADSRQRTAS